MTKLSVTVEIMLEINMLKVSRYLCMLFHTKLQLSRLPVGCLRYLANVLFPIIRLLLYKLKTVSPPCFLWQVENPSCLWGRFVKGPGIEAVENKKKYDDLQMKMNLFYHEVNLDVQKIKPSTIEAGQVIICVERVIRVKCNLWNVCFSILSLG